MGKFMVLMTLAVAVTAAACSGGGGATGGSSADTTTYMVAGKVSMGTKGVSGVTLNLEGGLVSTVTDSVGNYNLLVSNGTYTITPSKEGYTFSPRSMAVTVSGKNLLGKYFTTLPILADPVYINVERDRNFCLGQPGFHVYINGTDVGFFDDINQNVFYATFDQNIDYIISNGTTTHSGHASGALDSTLNIRCNDSNNSISSAELVYGGGYNTYSVFYKLAAGCSDQLELFAYDQHNMTYKPISYIDQNRYYEGKVHSGHARLMLYSKLNPSVAINYDGVHSIMQDGYTYELPLSACLPQYQPKNYQSAIFVKDPSCKDGVGEIDIMDVKPFASTVGELTYLSVCSNTYRIVSLETGTHSIYGTPENNSGNWKINSAFSEVLVTKLTNTDSKLTFTLMCDSTKFPDRYIVTSVTSTLPVKNNEAAMPALCFLPPPPPPITGSETGSVVDPTGQNTPSSTYGGSSLSCSGTFYNGSDLGGCAQPFYDPNYYNWYSFRNGCNQAISVRYDGLYGNSVGGTKYIAAYGRACTGYSSSEVGSEGGVRYAVCPNGYIAINSSCNAWGARDGMYWCRKL